MGQQTSKSNVLLDGFCDKNYEPVKEHLHKMLHEGAEENLQLCVYVDKKCVIDLYGTAVGDKSYNAESIQVRIIHGGIEENSSKNTLYCRHSTVLESLLKPLLWLCCMARNFFNMKTKFQSIGQSLPIMEKVKLEFVMFFVMHLDWQDSPSPFHLFSMLGQKISN